MNQNGKQPVVKKNDEWLKKNNFFNYEATESKRVTLRQEETKSTTIDNNVQLI